MFHAAVYHEFEPDAESYILKKKWFIKNVLYIYKTIMPGRISQGKNRRPC